MIDRVSVVVVFRVLDAFCVSWTIPLAVLLIVPMGVPDAVLLLILPGLFADVCVNVGLITIIGLAARNAILIVEFAIEEVPRQLPKRKQPPPSQSGRHSQRHAHTAGNGREPGIRGAAICPPPSPSTVTISERESAHSSSISGAGEQSQ